MPLVVSLEETDRLTILVESIGQQRLARTMIDGWLRERSCGSDAIDATKLVATELMTNAFEHGRASEVRVGLVGRDEDLILRISHPSDARTPLPELDRAVPETESRRHRGLAIVGRLTEELTAAFEGEHLVIEATIPASADC